LYSRANIGTVAGAEVLVSRETRATLTDVAMVVVAAVFFWLLVKP
jgi:hypothetical protein